MGRKRYRPARAGREFYYFDENTTLGWAILRSISFEAGERQVALGVARRVLDYVGNHIGYQRATPPPAPTQATTLTAAQTFSAADVMLNAGTVFRNGRSRTARLNEEQRKDRVSNGFEAEDHIERVTERLRLYPYPAPGRGDRAVRVYPKAP